MAETEIQLLAREKLAGHGPLRLLMRREIRRASELMRPGERPLALAPGVRNDRIRDGGGLLIATDQRFLLVERESELAIGYEELSLRVDDTIKGDAAHLLVTARGQTQRFGIRPASLAIELAGVATR